MKYQPIYRYLCLLLLSVMVLLTGCIGEATVTPTIPESMTPKVTNTDVATMTPSPTNTATAESSAISASVHEPVAGMEIKQGADVDLLEDIGVYWVRRNGLQWFKVEPQAGERDWSDVAQLEDDLIRISEAGMKAILIIRGTPDWAQRSEGQQCGPIQIEALDDYAVFLQDAISRYKEPPFNVVYWELGNEPDVDPNQVPPTSPFGCWGDASDTDYYGGAYYAEMLKVAYPAIKEIDPNAQVLVGGLLMDCDPLNPPETAPGSGQRRDCTSSRFLEGILANGGGEYFDGVSFHAYDYYQGAVGIYSNSNWNSAWNTTGPVMLAKVGYIREVLARYGKTEKYLMNTETALLCGRDGSEAECQTEIYNNTKAYYIIQNNTISLAEGIRANIWYYLQGWRGSGLIDEERQPLPAYQAYQFNNEILSDMTYTGRVSASQGIEGYEFRQGESILWILWSLDGEAHELVIPGEITAIYDAFGNPLPEELKVSVTLAPMYLQWTTK